MRLQTAWAIVLASALLLPLAQAGDEANPDITDTADATSSPDLDFLAAWFEPDPSGVVFTFKVREMDNLTPDHGMAIGFDFNGARWIAMVAVTSSGKLATSLRTTQQFAASNSPEKMQGGLDRVSAKTGKPGSYTARIPYASVPGLGPGSVLQNVGASTIVYTPGNGWKEADGTRALDGYAVQRALLPPALAHALPYVAGGALLVAAGAAGAWALLRRRAAPPGQPPAEGVRAPLPESPPGRMSLKPPP